MLYILRPIKFNEMKHFFPLLWLAVLSVWSNTAFSQTNALFNPDYGGDGFIGVDDILMSLSFFGNPWEGPVVVAGCTNPTACNYIPIATNNDGSCDYSCFGCVSPSMDNYTYQVVQINGQCWFAENLRTKTYATGDTIPTVSDSGAWQNQTTGATCVYDNNETLAAQTSYGRLYNWYAVNNSQGLCPNGWHVPSNLEWNELWNNAGESDTEASVALRSTSGWDEYDSSDSFPGSCPNLVSGNGTDTFGFSALPSGHRYGYFGGSFYNQGNGAYWWTSQIAGYPAGKYMLSNPQAGPSTTWDKKFGLSVRCVQDSE